MKRLTVFLCGMLLLASCEDIDEARMLPKEFSIGDITDLSELTYDEVENLAIDADYQDLTYLREEMRRSGGLIIKGAVNLKEGEAYDDASLWLSDKESELPTDDGYWGGGNAHSVGNLASAANPPLFYVQFQDMVDFRENPASAFYCKMALDSWNEEHPGFLDDCLYKGFDGTVFSGVKSYSKETPYIFDCRMEEEGVLGMGFSVYSNYAVTQCGMCYSSSNQLPDLEDEVAYYLGYNEADSRDFYVGLRTLPKESGTYYVRGFAVSEKGISYSPVQKVVCKGGYVEAKADTVINVSDMAYSELENMRKTMYIYDYEYDRMIRNSGLLFVTSVQEQGYSYDDMAIRVTDERHDIDILYPVNEDRNHPVFFHSYAVKAAEIFSYIIELRISDLYGYTMYPWKGQYAMPEVPTIYDCDIRSGAASFSIESSATVTRVGVCYSTSNELPLIQNDQTLDGSLPLNGYSEIFFGNDVLAPGIYYMRAFAVSEKGAGYSPVQRVEIY